MSKSLNVIGISAFYHDSACCLLRGGKLLAAASEERFSRLKHDARLPVEAFRYCLNAGGIGLPEIDAIAYYESPVKKLARQLWAGVPAGTADQHWLDPQLPGRSIRERLGYDGPLFFFDHHQSHAASAYLYSGFAEAAILTADGVGEWATTSYGLGWDDAIEIFEEVEFPHSLGVLYSTITAYLGFKVNSGEFKVMGLAAFGSPRFLDLLRRLLDSDSSAQFRLDLRYFDFISGRRMFSDQLQELLGFPPRGLESEIEQHHCDLACSVQQLLEETLLEKVRHLARQIDSPNLCLAGGVALNSVANGRIAREGPFEKLFIQPAAGDAGGSLGAAALAHHELSLGGPRASLNHVYLGPSWSAHETARFLEGTGVAFRHYTEEPDLLQATVDRLRQGQVIGWFQGAMEFGPRALGARSILADARREGIQQHLNQIKKRETFRPFAPSVLADRAGEYFELQGPSPFMSLTCSVRSHSIPGVTHADRSARPQTVDGSHPRFEALLKTFHQRTGCPLLLNTSLNVRGEPICCSPADALGCLVECGLDALVLEDCVIDRQRLSPGWIEAVQTWRSGRSSSVLPDKTFLLENLYTFV